LKPEISCEALLRVDQAKPRGKEAAPRRRAPLACPEIQCGLRAAGCEACAERHHISSNSTQYMPLSRFDEHRQAQLDTSRADCILVQDIAKPNLLAHPFDDAPPLSAAALCGGSTERSEPPCSSLEYLRGRSTNNVRNNVNEARYWEVVNDPLKSSFRIRFRANWQSMHSDRGTQRDTGQVRMMECDPGTDVSHQNLEIESDKDAGTRLHSSDREACAPLILCLA
jgi:hypothetical protein